MTTPTFPTLPDTDRLARLRPPEGRVEVVLDTDTDNEIDDQYALAYAVLSPDRIDLQAVYAAPYHNERSTGPADGMVKSHAEMNRVLERLGRPTKGFTFRGSDRWLTGNGKPIESEATADLIERAMRRPAGAAPLYVVAIGAITNVASALLLEPRLVEKVTVVWLAGHPFYWHTAHEFNLKQDPQASRVMFDSGVPLVFVPCKNVAEHLRLSRADVDRYVQPCGAVGKYLHQVYDEQVKDEPGRTRVIWDMSTIAWLINPKWVPSAVMPAPLLTDQLTWSHHPYRHGVRCAMEIHRDAVFADFFGKLKQQA